MSDTWDEFIFGINRWVEKHNQHPDKLALKLIEEVGELIGARLKGRWAEVEEEYADVLIVLASLAELDEVDLAHEVHRKLAIVSSRKGVVRDGIFVKQEDLELP